MPRKLVEDCRRIDVRNLPRTRLRSVLRWEGPEGELAARAVLEVDGEVVRIAYRWRDEERWLARKLDVALQARRTPAGGVYRVWRFQTAKTLYEAVAGLWGCRSCLGLADQVEGKPLRERAERRLRKLRRYCGGNEDLSLPFPACPDGMRATTYAMLREEARQLEEALARTFVGGDTGRGHGVRRANVRWWPGKNAASEQWAKIGMNTPHENQRC